MRIVLGEGGADNNKDARLSLLKRCEKGSSESGKEQPQSVKFNASGLY